MSSAKGTVSMTSKSSISGSSGSSNPVHPKLLDGCKFVKWDDDTGVGIPVTLKVDRNSFFLYWIDQNGDTEFLEISSIRDTRTGKYARTPRSEGKLKESINIGPQEQTLEEKTLTVVYGPDFVNVSFINFCTDSRDTAQLWTNEILKMAYNLMAINASVYRFLEKAHTRLLLMTDRDGRLPVKNVVKMFASHKDDKKRIEKALEACDLPSGKTDTIHPDKINLQKFLDFYKHLIVRSEVMEIFEKMCNSCSNTSKKKVMNVDQFVDFLNKEQRDPRLNEILYPYANRSRAHDLIEQYEPSKELAAKGLFSFDGFLRYLMSADNAIVPPDKFELNCDMDQPLSHYFINSSHNTYLTGHQLTGKSSVEIYRQCLLAGCRCIELDCWNGRSDDEPIITHGYTVVTDVPLKEVLEAICESAFKTSEYPVILSFENHCSSKQQAKMAAYCRKIFGEMLLTEPLPGHPLKPGVPLPSPNQFLRKIIIKNKKKHYKRNRKTKNIPPTAAATANTSTSASTMTITTSANNGDDVSSIGTASTTVSAPQHVPLTATTSSSPSANASPSTYETRPELVTSNSDDSGPSGSSQAGPSTLPETDDLLLLSSNVDSNNTSDQPHHHHQQPTANSSSTNHASNSNIIKNSSCDIDDADSDSSLEDEDVIEEHSIADLSGSTANATNVVAAVGGSKEPEAGSEMSELVIYVQPIRFHAFELAEKRDRSFEVSSFDETQSTSLLKERPIDFVNYNKRQMSRIYPRGTRVNSSNYMPQIFWNAGCQMVALNFQTLDLGMQLNLGIFEYNGRNGYLLKPDFMRRQDRRFDPFTESTVDGIIAGTVSIKIISGQFLCDKRVGTYVEVDMYGLPADTVRRKRTRIVPANGLNPIYDEEPFVFKKVVLPDLACLRIAVFEENGKFIGTRILPVVGLRPGYRHISLRNESLQPLTLATLFVHITVKDYVPDGLSELADALANPIAYQSMVEKHAKQLLALTDEADEAALAEGSGGGGGHHPSSATSKVSSGSGGQPSTTENQQNYSRSSHDQDDSLRQYIRDVHSLNEGDGNSYGSHHHHSHLNKSETARSEALNGGASSGGGGTSSSKVSSPNHKSFSGGTGSGSGGMRRQDTLNRKVTTSMKVFDDYVLDKIPSLLESSEAILSAEPLEKLRQAKAVQKIYAKLERDVTGLAKKYDKSREKCRESYLAEEEKAMQALEKQKKLASGTSSKSMKKNADGSKRTSVVDIQVFEDEYNSKVRDLQKTYSDAVLNLLIEQHKEEFKLFEFKYHEQLSQAFDKVTEESQSAQIATLKNLHDKEVAVLMKRLENQNKEELVAVSKKFKDKNELARIKRELQQRLIDQAVNERQRFKTLHAKLETDLKLKHEEVKRAVEEEKRSMVSRRRKAFEEKVEQMRQTYKMDVGLFLQTYLPAKSA